MGRYFEYKNNKTIEFCEVSFEAGSNELIICQGAIGTKGKTIVKKFDTLKEVLDEFLKIGNEKVNNGYIEKDKEQPAKVSRKGHKQKKTIDQVLSEIYDANLSKFKKGVFQVEYQNNQFKIYQEDGSHEASFLTFIHYILFYEKLYEDYFSAKVLKLVSSVIKKNPDLPPYFKDQSTSDRFDELIYDATKFTYEYLRNNKIYCEEMNNFIKNTFQDWKPLKK